MNIEEAILYLEHTSKDDFNLEEHQKENRYQAIQVVLKEIERLNNIINELQSRIEDIRRNVIKRIEKIYNIEDYSELITIKNICEEELK